MVKAIHDWQQVFLDVLGHRMVFAADEYYLMARHPFPDDETYGDFPMHEDGIGMARAFEEEFVELLERSSSPSTGFFQWVDGAPASGYRAPRNPAGDTGLRQETARSTRVTLGARSGAPIGVLTAPYGARVLAPLIASLDRADVRILEGPNDWFGGNTAVTGLMVGADIARRLESEPSGHRYLLPDVCLSEGRFLDGVTIDELPRPVEVVATDGASLRLALQPRGIK